MMAEYKFHTDEDVILINGFPVPESVYDLLVEIGRNHTSMTPNDLTNPNAATLTFDNAN